MRSKDAKKETERITNFLKDDAKVERLLKQISDVIDDVVFSQTIESGTLRDYIKSDTVAESLRERFLKIPCPK